MKKIITILTCSFCCFYSVCAQEYQFKTKFDDAYEVLNLGTFHMGETTDANRTEFDEHDASNVKEVHDLALRLARFKPTVIVVEVQPQFQSMLDSQYRQYLKNPGMKFDKPNEVQLLAFEVGRLSGAERIYAIDYKEGYNYMIGNTVDDKKGKQLYQRYADMMNANERDFYQQLNRQPTVLDMIRGINLPEYLDYLINVNADMLTYIASKGKWEGAEEAAKFYHRNLVMYSNLNQIELKPNDRLFILMGATHTAYFKEFMKRSPKYKLADVKPYLD